MLRDLYVTLGVRDLKRSASFYRELGFVVSYQHADQLGCIDLAAVQVLLCPWPLLAAEFEQLESQLPKGASTLSVHVGQPQDVEQWHQRVARAGATILAKPRVRPWGGLTLVFADPDGHRWEVVHRKEKSS